MCMGGGGGGSGGPSAADLARQRADAAEHQSQLSLIQAEREQMGQQQKILSDSQAAFQTQQQNYATQLTEWTKTTAARPTPAVPTAPGTVSTGGASGVATDSQVESDAAIKKRGRASLKIDLTSASAGGSASGLNIPIG